jgi:threonine synthase
LSLVKTNQCLQCAGIFILRCCSDKALAIGTTLQTPSVIATSAPKICINYPAMSSTPPIPSSAPSAAPDPLHHLHARGLIERWRTRLPVTATTPVISLGEGNTPLVELRGPPEARELGIRVYAKFDGANPTGSFKDRGMTMAVSKAVEAGATAIACASTGNTSAAAAAYAARAGIECLIILPAGYVAAGKIAQTILMGAKIIQIDGNFDDALRLVRLLCDESPVALVNSVNPYRIEGQKTIAFEICEEFGWQAPEYHAMPVGNAGNITAHWQGYSELFDDGTTTSRPKMLGFQAAGAAPIVLGHAVENPETIATAIRIGNPASWSQALAARDHSGGLIEAVTDEEILAAYQLLAREGLFCEPASAASFAGAYRLIRRGRIEPGSRIVCTLTGHGLKDPTTAGKLAALPEAIPATLEAVMRASGV